MEPNQPTESQDTYTRNTSESDAETVYEDAEKLEPVEGISNPLTRNKVVFYQSPMDSTGHHLTFDVVIAPGFAGKLFELDRRQPEQSQHISITSGVMTGHVSDRGRQAGPDRETSHGLSGSRTTAEGTQNGAATKVVPVVLVPGDEYEVAAQQELSLRNGSHEIPAVVRVRVTPALDTEQFIRTGYEEAKKFVRQMQKTPPEERGVRTAAEGHEGSSTTIVGTRSTAHKEERPVPMSADLSMEPSSEHVYRQADSSENVSSGTRETQSESESRVSLIPSLEYIRGSWKENHKRLLSTISVGGAFILLLGIILTLGTSTEGQIGVIAAAIAFTAAIPAWGYLAAVFRKGMTNESDLPSFSSLEVILERERLFDGLLVAAVTFVATIVPQVAGTVLLANPVGILLVAANNPIITSISVLIMSYVSAAILGLVLEERRLSTTLKFLALGKRLGPVFKSRVYLFSVLTATVWIYAVSIVINIMGRGGIFLSLVAFGLLFVGMMVYFHYLGRLWAEVRARGLVGDPVPEEEYTFQPKTELPPAIDLKTPDSGQDTPR